MKYFLQEISEHLVEAYGSRLKDCCLVFPNRRAGVFFKKHLAACISRPVWSPAVYTITDLMLKISDFERADDLELVFDLYELYVETGKSKESFDSFYSWGEIVLADFNDIDKYLVNPSDLFQNITDLKEIEHRFSFLTEDQVEVIRRFWKNFHPDEGKHEKQFLELWQILQPLYTKLYERLSNKHTGYEGMIYKNVADKINSDGDIGLPFEKIIFAGFNALNECEKVLFRYLMENQAAEFIWDFDDYYLNNPTHEAGRFIRKNKEEFKQEEGKFEHRHIGSGNKKIQIINCPSNVSQAKGLSRFLDKNDHSPDTAVVLADEGLLMPVLHSLPGEIEEVNITMGYPVRETPVYSLVEHLINLQSNRRDKTRFYHKDVLSVLNHPYLMRMHAGDCRSLISTIHERNWIYVPGSGLTGNSLFALVFKQLKDSMELPDYLLHILEHIARFEQRAESAASHLENEFIYQLYIRINRLKDILEQRDVKLTAMIMNRLLRKVLMNSRIPFAGEPLSGLQVMGILETRVLDFRKVIVLSMNEDSIPGSAKTYSFIPHHLRLGFSLPSLEHQDAIYAYYFYRLIQRAEEVVLMYNSQSEGVTTGEKSRFIYQLLFDPKFDVEEKVLGFNVSAVPEKTIEIGWDENVVKSMMKYSADQEDSKYLSPSSLNTYIDCSLKFYFKYLADLKEPDEVVDEVDPMVFGNLLHHTVNTLYKPYMDRTMGEDDLNRLSGSDALIDSAIFSAFRNEKLITGEKEDSGLQGNQAVIGMILKKYIKAVMGVDRHYAPLKIVSLERPYYMRLKVEHNPGVGEIIVGGTIDRVDLTGNELRIIDYKTGDAGDRFNMVSELFVAGAGRNNAAFQTLTYAKLFSQCSGEDHEPIVPGLYRIRKLLNNTYDFRFKYGPPNKKKNLEDFMEVEQEFSVHLLTLVNNLFNPALAFSQTPDKKLCEYCPYCTLCHR